MARYDHVLGSRKAGTLQSSGAYTVRSRWWKQILGPRVAPYLFIAPFFLLFAIFWVFPVFWSIVLSFEHWTASATSWVGLANYRFVLGLSSVQQAFANLAACYNLPVIPHVGDMMQVHQHLVASTPNAPMLEYIPWILDLFEYPVQVENGYIRVPEEPGASTRMRADSLARWRVA